MDGTFGVPAVVVGAIVGQAPEVFEVMTEVKGGLFWGRMLII